MEQKTKDSVMPGSGLTLIWVCVWGGGGGDYKR